MKVSFSKAKSKAKTEYPGEYGPGNVRKFLFLTLKVQLRRNILEDTNQESSSSKTENKARANYP